MAPLCRIGAHFHPPHCPETQNSNAKGAPELASPVGRRRRNVMDRNRFVVVAMTMNCNVLFLKTNMNKKAQKTEKSLPESISKSWNNASLNLRRKWLPFNKLQPKLIVQVLVFYIRRLVQDADFSTSSIKRIRGTPNQPQLAILGTAFGRILGWAIHEW
jgi:hypothetical protein